jgi:cardiolipin synthase
MAEPSRRILTIPNVLSAIRILLIPVFVLMLLNEGTRFAGLMILGLIVSTDWVDGAIARRTGTVTELGKVLDPLADRLAVIAALITFIAIEAIPLWAALIVLIRDAVVLGAAIWLASKDVRIDVRPIGKYATFTLWWGMGGIAWGNLGFAFPNAFLVFGWTWFIVGAIEYYVAAAAYARDVRKALA